jgi:hypothetical protein
MLMMRFRLNDITKKGIAAENEPTIKVNLIPYLSLNDPKTNIKSNPEPPISPKTRLSVASEKFSTSVTYIAKADKKVEKLP